MISARHLLNTQRGHLFPWLAVAFAMGVGAYFSLRFEPGAALQGAVAFVAGVAALTALPRHEVLRPLSLTVLFVSLGFLAALWRAHDVAGPVLGWRYYGPVEGRIVGMDRSASDAVRLTLDQVRLSNVPAEETPRRVRISLHGDAAELGPPQPGTLAMTTGHLSAPGGPVEPGGFDFQRHAWFLELGAVGYTRVPTLALAPSDGGVALAIFKTRMAISDHVRQVLPGDIGGFAAAVTTGDRSGISQEALEALRASNTAHLLAISGLHMGLLSAFVFGALRLGLALVPYLALRCPTRKLAATGALAAATIYLMLSGGNVATERAFVMVAVALCAILLDRRALSLRSVAIAALIVLALRPEALLGPGFQMSFAATTALVAVFQALRNTRLGWGIPGAQSTISLVLSSAVAGLATAPIGAAHFNAISHYGLLANLLSVPLMGVLVVPAAVASALMAVIGLEEIGLWAMGLGLQWILSVAHFVAGLDGARSFVVGPPSHALPILSLGFLFVILWQGRFRWAGLVAATFAIATWTQAERPDVLIAEGGALVGVMTPEGRAVSKSRGAGFVASNWLENDGDPSSQTVAAERWPTSPPQLGNLTFQHLSGKKAVRSFDTCASGDLIVANQPLELDGCRILDPDAMQATGAIAVSLGPQGLEFTSVRDLTGKRLWSNWPEP